MCPAEAVQTREVIPTSGMHPSLYSTEAVAAVRISVPTGHESRGFLPNPRARRARDCGLRHRSPMNTRHSSENARWRGGRRILLAALLAFCVAAGGSVPAAAEDDAQKWAWPGGVARVVRAYEQPPTPYEAGHRGIDIAVAGSDIVSPADGAVAFRGVVVDRPLITIDHGGGLVSTLEPVDSDLSPGQVVARGEVIGTLAVGGHAAHGSLHLGARLDGEYINPLALLGAVERPVLLPCCS